MIFFFKERMKRNCYLNEHEEHEVESFDIAQEIYQQLQQSENFKMNHAEITYLGKLLLGASRLNDDAAAEGKLDLIVEKIIAEFERLACVNFEDHRNLKKIYCSICNQPTIGLNSKLSGLTRYGQTLNKATVMCTRLRKNHSNR